MILPWSHEGGGFVVQSLFNGDGVRWMSSSLVTKSTGRAPVGPGAPTDDKLAS